MILTRFNLAQKFKKGNSGGPLIGPGGTVVGVVKSKLDALKVSSISQDLPQNVNFAVKSSVLIKFLTGTPSIPFTRPLNAGVTINPIGIFFGIYLGHRSDHCQAQPSTQEARI